jgi:hypothetical protein
VDFDDVAFHFHGITLQRLPQVMMVILYDTILKSPERSMHIFYICLLTLCEMDH